MQLLPLGIIVSSIFPNDQPIVGLLRDISLNPVRLPIVGLLLSDLVIFLLLLLFLPLLFLLLLGDRSGCGVSLGSCRAELSSLCRFVTKTFLNFLGQFGEVHLRDP